MCCLTFSAHLWSPCWFHSQSFQGTSAMLSLATRVLHHQAISCLSHIVCWEVGFVPGDSLFEQSPLAASSTLSDTSAGGPSRDSCLCTGRASPMLFLPVHLSHRLVVGASCILCQCADRLLASPSPESPISGLPPPLHCPEVGTYRAAMGVTGWGMGWCSGDSMGLTT